MHYLYTTENIYSYFLNKVNTRLNKIFAIDIFIFNLSSPSSEVREKKSFYVIVLAEYLSGTLPIWVSKLIGVCVGGGVQTNFLRYNFMMHKHSRFRVINLFDILPLISQCFNCISLFVPQD